MTKNTNEATSTIGTSNQNSPFNRLGRWIRESCLEVAQETSSTELTELAITIESQERKPLLSMQFHDVSRFDGLTESDSKALDDQLPGLLAKLDEGDDLTIHVEARPVLRRARYLNDWALDTENATAESAA